MSYGTLKYLKMDLPEGFQKVDKKTVQERSVPILKEVVRIAEKHNIPVYPIFGTMLGLVRHDGFIPWDDDIDICVSYWDRDRLFEVLEKELPKNLVAWSNRNNGQQLPTMGVYSNDRKMIAASYFENGTYGWNSIDIFELARVNKASHHKKLKFAYGLMFVRNSSGGGAQKFARFWLKCLPKSFYAWFINHREKKYIDKNGQYEVALVDDSKNAWKAIFNGEWEYRNFEGVKIRVPKNPETFLNDWYGNWKQIPDEKSINWNTHYFGEEIKK